MSKMKKISSRIDKPFFIAAWFIIIVSSFSVFFYVGYKLIYCGKGFIYFFLNLSEKFGFPFLVTFIGAYAVYGLKIQKDVSTIKDSNEEIKQNISELKDFKDGMQYYIQKDYEAAFSIWKELAEQGGAHAQYTLALLYYRGEGVSKNYEEAFKWYHKAAEQGHAGSQYDLALMYERGESVAQNYDEAIKWYLKAAKQGLAEAQYNLAHKYTIAKTSIKNYIKAYMWYSIAEANGVKNAKHLIYLLEKAMTAEQITKAKEMARRCLESNYEDCGEE